MQMWFSLLPHTKWPRLLLALAAWLLLLGLTKGASNNPGGGSGNPVTGYGQAINPAPPSNGLGRR